MMKYIIAIQNILFLVFLFSPGAIGYEYPTWWKQVVDEAERDGYGLVTPEGLKALYDSGEDFLIVDVRPQYEFQQAYLPKAVNFEFDPGDRLQLKTDKRNAFKELLGPDKNRKIIMYCRSFR